jgi:hypothetical protein
MHSQIASAVELLQGHATNARQPATNPQAYPDPLTLFVLFRQGSSQAHTEDTPLWKSESNRVPLATSCLTITQGNINHSHIYLTGIMNLFPDDVMGGKNKKDAAPKAVCVHWGDDMVYTDIDSEKRMFRRRGWLRRFFEANRITAGDRVLFEQLEPYIYRVSKEMGNVRLSSLAE